MPEYTLRVNGVARTVRTGADTPLLYVLRNDLGKRLRDLPFTPDKVRAALA